MLTTTIIMLTKINIKFINKIKNILLIEKWQI